MRTSFPLGSGETQKGSTRKCCLSTLLHVWTRCPEASRVFHFDPRTGPPRRGKFGLPQDRQAPGGRPPWFLLYAVFATHPQRREYSRPSVAPTVIAPQHRRLAVTSSISLVSALRQKLVHFAVPALPNGSLIRWEPFYGWRVPQGSPASPWEGVSKFHYPPRCRRARPATAGSKVRVDRSVRSLFTSSELPSWRRAFRRYSHGFCAWNTVYSVVGGRIVPPHLSGGL